MSTLNKKKKTIFLNNRSLIELRPFAAYKIRSFLRLMYFKFNANLYFYVFDVLIINVF